MTRVRRYLPRIPVLYATVLFFVACAVVKPQSVNSTALNAMLPFAAVLVVAAIGQTLVVQQRGIDLSVAGTVTLSAVIVSKLPQDNGDLPLAILVALGVAALIGALLGVVVTYLRVTPLIATFGMNAVLGGAVLFYSSGEANRVPAALSSLGLGKTLGVLNIVWFALALTAIAALVMTRTPFGRSFVAVGANLDAARASGLRVGVIRSSAYVISSMCYAMAGIMLAGYLSVPDLQVGESYVMPSIAAVVLGGTLFAGGRGHLAGTMIAAVLLSQLNQFVLSVGASTAMQFIVQGGVIAVAAAFQTSRGLAIVGAARRLLTPRKVAST